MAVLLVGVANEALAPVVELLGVGQPKTDSRRHLASMKLDSVALMDVVVGVLP